MGDSRVEVTVVAAEAIEEIAWKARSIDPKFLPEILQGLDKGHSGLPNALATIRTEEARAEFVKRYLADSSSPGNQYQNGFERYGIDFLPCIIKAILAGENANRKRSLLSDAVSHFPEPDRKTAAGNLMECM